MAPIPQCDRVTVAGDPLAASSDSPVIQIAGAAASLHEALPAPPPASGRDHPPRSPAALPPEFVAASDVSLVRSGRISRADRGTHAAPGTGDSSALGPRRTSLALMVSSILTEQRRPLDPMWTGAAAAAPPGHVSTPHEHQEMCVVPLPAGGVSSAARVPFSLTPPTTPIDAAASQRRLSTRSHVTSILIGQPQPQQQQQQPPAGLAVASHWQAHRGPRWGATADGLLSPLPPGRVVSGRTCTLNAEQATDDFRPRGSALASAAAASFFYQPPDHAAAGTPELWGRRRSV